MGEDYTFKSEVKCLNDVIVDKGDDFQWNGRHPKSERTNDFRET